MEAEPPTVVEKKKKTIAIIGDKKRDQCQGKVEKDKHRAEILALLQRIQAESQPRMGVQPGNVGELNACRTRIKKRRPRIALYRRISL